jgi:hypothetical protein
MAGEAVSSRPFREALAALDDGRQIEVDFAIYAIEDDPFAENEFRHPAPADSPYSGFTIDFTVDGYGILYRVVDQGAAIELWYLYPLPEPPAERRGRPRSPSEPYPPFM